MTEPKTISDWIDEGLGCFYLLLMFVYVVVLPVTVIIGISHLILPDTWLAFMFGSNLHQWFPWLEPAIKSATPFFQVFAFAALGTWPAAYIILKRIDETDRKINNLWISIYHDDGLESRIKNLIAYRADDIKEQITSSSELARNGTPLDRWLKTMGDKRGQKGSESQ